ncbi:precorrin-6Y C5,15-methyltransferase (decarboxylating) [Methanocorpusculum labreanum Z]|uniref:Precorrin-6Y C5,15-methyltransferase (Decarboxylating) n=1 Tax=Methanocorpusculum labreanum (strain ATCC 43576 / DSM 4855 / Z) TaxID=410358 RepID=A2SSE6_METLZ|nr:cobalt-precorrin-7 (C(5))-methyltransferase [Methanocorpusculum labreanum]ABN07252.1 precorrin-6Y C5,15-methyltransferase (decarboxylating) [Methanocorpusculum labreanum Z]
MKIVGVGCGEGMLTEEGERVLAKAKVIYGSGRSIDLVRAFIPAEAEVFEITDYKALRTLPDDAVVLSTGDPLMAGLGYLPGEIISGISSMQAAFARLHAPWTNVAVVNAHGKNHQDAVYRVVHDIAAGHSVFLIADPDFSVEELARSLPESVTIAVCEDLGYPYERIAEGTAKNPPKVLSKLFCIVAGYNEQ